jgi:hypothetical protein
VEVSQVAKAQDSRGAGSAVMTLSAADTEPTGEQLWAGLSEETQARLLSLFARLIARTVIVEEEEELT